MFSFLSAQRIPGCCLSKTVLSSDIWSPGRTGCAGSAIDKSVFMFWSTLAMHPWLPTQDTSGPLQEHSGHQVMLKGSELGLSSSFRAVLNSYTAVGYVCNTTFSTYSSPHSCPTPLTFPSAWEQPHFCLKLSKPLGQGRWHRSHTNFIPISTKAFKNCSQYTFCQFR